jgi:hypothetical protein
MRVLRVLLDRQVQLAPQVLMELMEQQDLLDLQEMWAQQALPEMKALLDQLDLPEQRVLLVLAVLDIDYYHLLATQLALDLRHSQLIKMPAIQCGLLEILPLLYMIVAIIWLVLLPVIVAQP